MDMFLSLFICPYPIQPVGRNKIGIPAAKPHSLLIHYCGKPFHAASYVLRYHPSRIIIGFQHQGIQKVLQPVLLSLPYPQVHLGLGGGIGGRLHRILPPSVLQSQDTGHNFRGTGHGPDNILSLPIQNSAGIPIHKDSMGLFAMDGSETFISAVFTIVPIALATMMEHIGDIAAISATTGKNYIRDPGLNKTLLGDGLATAMAGLLGGPANTTYGENTGVLALTKIYDPLVIRIAAVFAMILSFCPKFEAVINTIPSGIVGGISFVLYGMISAIGVRNVVENRVDFSNSRNLIIAAVILVCALGFNSVGGITFAIAGVSINLSGLAIAAIAGILLNALLPGNDYQFDEGSNEPESASLRV